MLISYPLILKAERSVNRIYWFKFIDTFFLVSYHLILKAERSVHRTNLFKFIGTSSLVPYRLTLKAKVQSMKIADLKSSAPPCWSLIIFTLPLIIIWGFDPSPNTVSGHGPTESKGILLMVEIRSPFLYCVIIIWFSGRLIIYVQ